MNEVLNSFCVGFCCAEPPLFRVCSSVFEVPANYHRRGVSRHMPVSNNDEELLQYAIHQSLLESHGQVRKLGKTLYHYLFVCYLKRFLCLFTWNNVCL